MPAAPRIPHAGEGWYMERNNRKYSRGFTIAEFVITAMLATLLLTMMIPATLTMIEEARNRKVVDDLQEMEDRIDAFHKANARYPLSLIEIYSSIPIDPWGNPYQYLDIADAPNQHRIKPRKYKHEYNINDDYDLYSMGADGRSEAPLTAKPSRDDIIRANNGHYLGSVLDYH